MRIIKDKLETFQKLNDSKSIIQAVKDRVEDYNDTFHRSIGKSPNEMTREDVQKNAVKKREHNDEVMNKISDNVQGKTVGVLEKKNLFDRGNKAELARGSHKVENIEGYNFKLDNGHSLPPKDLVVLKDKQ